MAIATAAVFAAAVGFEFVRFDDPTYTFACPFVMGGLSLSNIAAAVSDFTHGGIWMPVTYLSYMLDISVFGGGPFGHHLVNVVLHVLNAALLFSLLLRLSAPRPNSKTRKLANSLTSAAALAAALWALHPLRAEPVCWIAARKELLWSAFALLGIIAFLRGRQWWSLVFCVLACLSKPTAMCFPVLVWAAWGLANRGSSASGFGPRLADAVQHSVSSASGFGPRLAAPGVVRALCCMFAAALATAFIAAYSQTHASGYDARSLFTTSLGNRLAAAAHAFFVYVGEIVLPVNLHADVRRVVPLPMNDARLWVGIVVVVAFTAWAVRRRSREAMWCAVFFLAALAPTLGVFGSFGREARADRFLYVPSMAVAIFMVFEFSSFRVLEFCSSQGSVPTGDCPQSSRADFFKKAGVFAVLLVFSVLAVRQVFFWRNDLTLFSRVLEVDSSHPRALAHIGSEECARFGNFDSGIEHFRKSLALEYAPNVVAELAYALVARGRPEDRPEARRLAESVASDPRADRSGIARKALQLLEKGNP